MSHLSAIRLRRPLTAVVAIMLAVCCLTSCSTQKVGFPYPDEKIVFPDGGAELTRLHLVAVRDSRPAAQRDGEGHFAGVTFPADENWERPVSDIYFESLARDITETRMAELTPLPRQAAYVLEADILSMHCRMEREPTSFLLPPALGMIGGFIWGDDMSSRLKRGAVLGVLALGAVPVPLHVRAEAEVELILRDASGDIVWRQICIGEVEDNRGEPATAKPVKKLAERYLPQAVKRCNACLLGQLRQFLISQGTD